MSKYADVVISAVVSRRAARVAYISAPEANVSIRFVSSSGLLEPIEYGFHLDDCDDLCIAESVGRLVAWWYLKTLDAEPAYLQELSLRRVNGEIVASVTMSAHRQADAMSYVLHFPSSSSVDRAEAEARSHLHAFFADVQAALDEPVRAVVESFNANPALWSLVPAEARTLAQRRLAGMAAAQP